MTRQHGFERLLSPVRVGSLTLKNRIVKAPQDTHFVGLDAKVEDRVLAIYAALARGGAGTIVLASLPPIAMHPESHQIGVWDDEFIVGLAQVADAVHTHDCRIFLQLNHGGPAEGVHWPDGSPPWAPSTLTESDLPSPAPYFLPTRGLSLSEITFVEEAYVAGAERARKAGYDGVEVHAAHTYMLGSFLTRIWNHRDDEYGCQNVENRTRIAVDIIREIKRRLGADYPVGVRINGQEWEASGAVTIEEAVDNARAFQQAGADYISVSGYGHGPVPFKYLPDYWRYPEPREAMKPFVRQAEDVGLLIPAAAAVKKAVSVPVIGVGRLTPERGERLLREDKVDLVAFGRPLWADPDLPNKLASGRRADVRPCTRCAVCEQSPRRCRVNAALGTVDGYVLKPAATRRRVMVVGGGPAGMEAARVAAERGHEVTLYEKSGHLGGLLPLATMIKGTETEDIPALIEYLKGQMSTLGVKVHLNREVGPSVVQEQAPDAAIVAAGGKYVVPAIPGMDRSNVLTSEALAARVKLPLSLFGPERAAWLTKYYLPIGQRVAVVGGALEGVETAEFLVKRGRKVTILETGDQLGDGMPSRLLTRLLVWLDEQHVRVLTGVREYRDITDAGITVVNREGRVQTIEADAIIVALPQQSNAGVPEAITGLVAEVHLVGPSDEGKSWMIVDAIAKGHEAGCAV